MSALLAKCCRDRSQNWLTELRPFNMSSLSSSLPFAASTRHLRGGESSCWTCLLANEAKSPHLRCSRRRTRMLSRKSSLWPDSATALIFRPNSAAAHLSLHIFLTSSRCGLDHRAWRKVIFQDYLQLVPSLLLLQMQCPKDKSH